MSKKIKVCIVVISAIVVILILAGVYWHLTCYPSFAIKRMVSEQEKDYHMEWLMMVISDNPNIPIAKNIQEKIKEYSDWNNKTIEELQKYSAPLDIKVSAKIKDGKTAFQYKGYVTTQDGETIDYINEKVIDYVFVSSDELFN